MKKIIGVIHPFDAQQILYVYENGNKLAFEKVPLDKIPDMVFNLSKQYNVNQVNLSGSQTFNKKLVERIKQQEITKYNTNNLIIKCI